MKKVFTLITLFLFIMGCDMISPNTSPNRTVEDLLGKYQSLHKDVLDQLDEVISNEGLTAEQADKYKELMRKQYQNLTYSIKDEIIDGNMALITVEIEVYDYAKTVLDVDEYVKNNPLEFLDNSVQSKVLYQDYKLKELDKVKDRITYTLELGVTNKDDKWKLDTLNNTDRQKIHGLYQS